MDRSLPERKVCPKCGQNKGRDEFHTRADRPGQLLSWCKACDRERATARNASLRAERPARIKPTEKACTACRQVFSVESFPFSLITAGRRRSTCLPCHNAANLAYKAAHREKVRAAARAYYEANKERIKVAIKRSQAVKPDFYREIHSRWKRDHKDAVNASTHKRRNQIVCNGGHWTAAEWEALKARFEYRCLMCGKQEPEINLTVDHVIPVSAGGSNCIDNIQPLCKSCNSLKHRGVIDLRPKGTN